jgi:hypothetical protein
MKWPTTSSTALPVFERYKWFLSELKAVNRTVTPWVIVNFHFPMYTSYAGWETNILLSAEALHVLHIKSITDNSSAKVYEQIDETGVY